jgi:hypothetical protein
MRHDEANCFLELSKARALALIIILKCDKSHELYESLADIPEQRLQDLEEHAVALAARFAAVRMKRKLLPY